MDRRDFGLFQMSVHDRTRAVEDLQPVIPELDLLV